MVESYHWHLDVMFREDANRIAEKQAAFNRNIIRTTMSELSRVTAFMRLLCFFARKSLK
jgi:predicted transposase YbfD/YdcC